VGEPLEFGRQFGYDRRMLVATWCVVAVALLAIVYQVLETRRSRSTQALAIFRDSWESLIARQRRRRLAVALLEGMTVETIPDAAIQDVVNFFEDVGTAYRLGDLRLYGVYSTFHDDAVHYWSAIGEAYARECREGTENSQDYAEFERLVKRLNKYERWKTGHAPVIDAGMIREFLEVEAQLDQPITLESGIQI
jgi:hypothetical protein